MSAEGLPKLRLKARWRLLRGTVRTLVVGALVLGMAVGFLVRTALGHRIVLGWGLDQVRARVAGTLEVDEIRSATLFKGARLVGVRLATAEGRPFVTLDSLEAQWDLIGLITGTFALDDVRLWTPRFTLEGDSLGTTIGRWVHGERLAEVRASRGSGGDEAGGDGAGADAAVSDEAAASAAGFALDLRDVRIYDGAARLRLWRDPARSAARGDEGLLREERDGTGGVRWALDAEGVEARGPRVRIRAGGETRIELDEASGRLDMLRRPVQLERLVGQLRLQPGSTVLSLQELVAPGVDASGSIVISRPAGGTGGRTTDLDVELADFDVEPWQWLVGDRTPPMRGRARVVGRLDARRGNQVQWSALQARWGGGSVAGEGGVSWGGAAAVPELREVDLQIDGVDSGEFVRWWPQAGEVAGRLSGAATLDGPLDEFALDGRLSLDGRGVGERTLDGRLPNGPRVSVDVRGVVLSGDDGLGVRGLTLVADPLDLRIVQSFAPGVPLRGVGSLELSATGRVRDGMRVRMDAQPPDSRVLLDGSIRQGLGEPLVIDVQGDLSPLRFDRLFADSTSLGLRGAIAGQLRARGRLDALLVDARLSVEGRPLTLSFEGSARDPGSGLRAALEAEGVDLSELFARLPEPSRWSGRIEVEGAGRSLRDWKGATRAEISGARIGRVDVEAVEWDAYVVDRQLQIDTLRVRAEEVELEGAGRLGITRDDPAGELRLRLAADSLAGLRSLVRGNGMVVADGLTSLDREVLALQGIDADTLPRAAEVAAEGRVRGEIVLLGAAEAFDGRATLQLEDVHWGARRLRSARVDAFAEDLPRVSNGVAVDLAVDSLELFDRLFTRGAGTFDFFGQQGRARFELARDTLEQYRVAGGFDLDSVGGRIDLDSLDVRIDGVEYRSVHPSRIVWSEGSFALDSLTVAGGARDPVRVAARGRIGRRGEEQFDIDVEQMRLERLLRVLQREDLGWQGTVDGRVRVEGAAEAPRISAQLSGQDIAVDALRAERVRTALDYASGRVAVEADAWEGPQRLARLTGSWPIDASLDGERADRSDAPVALRLTLDSIPSAFALTLLEDLEQVQGTIQGQVDLGGTPAALEPDGELRLSNGAWTVGALGVRQQDAEVTLTLARDRTVRVAGRARSGGVVDITGTITLDEPTNPTLDLGLALDGFAAVDRRDIRGSVSGDLTLTGSYGTPVIQGRLQVDRGDLYLDEFQRNLGVVDLSDPRFFAMDTALVQTQALLAETRNPFLDNLLVIIDLGVRRNTWLRSPQLNVEMQGDLSLTFDRRQRDIVFVGELQAVRGQYQVLNRTFDVERGTVEFVGIPGINPNLDIEALARVRRRDGDPLTITANVEGTLVEPRVSLSSNEAAVAESDLLSYLAFGQSSAQTTTGTAGAVVSRAGGAAAAALGGTLTSSLAALAQGTGFLDYLSISQAVDASAINQGSTLSTFSGTQVEVGRYFAGGDYFAGLVLRPLARVAARGSLLAGARIEWQASDQYHLEVFAEDQFLRVGALGVQDLGLNAFLIYGLALFREWGY